MKLTQGNGTIKDDVQFVAKNKDATSLKQE